MNKMNEAVYKLKGGSVEYDNRIKAMTVAKAKAEDEGEPVTVTRKLLNTYEPVIRIWPDGREEPLEE